MSTYENQTGSGETSRMYQAQSLLKNSIMKANHKSGKPNSTKKSPSLMGKLFGAAFSGVIYFVSLVVIIALVFIYLF